MYGSRLLAIIAPLLILAFASAFHVPIQNANRVATRPATQDVSSFALFMSNDDGVVELADEEEKVASEEPKAEEAVAPFLSQGEISEEPMDLSDPKQARVAIYIILSLLPVLFLIPLMLGSRDLIPVEMLPPVEM